jgi:PAS domain S-box-containing protein
MRQSGEPAREFLNLTGEHGGLVYQEDRAAQIEPRDQMDEAWQRLAAIVESSDDAIIGKDLNGIITSWNKSAQRIFGYTPEEALGRSILILIPEDRQPEEPAILDRIRRGERVDHYETVRRRKDGSLVNISITVSPIRGSDGRIVGASKIARDITDRIRREQALRKVQDELLKLNDDLERRVQIRTAELAETVAELEAFSYSITHDLRAPLRSMQSFATLLEQDCSAEISPLGEDYIRRIVTSARRMDHLIQDVLTYSRMARSDLHLDTIDTEHLVQGIIESYPAFQSPGANIQVVRPLLRVLANEAALTQCLANLISNAIKFVVPGEVPRVTIWSEALGDKVRVYVRDHGIGIPTRHQERIFGIFQRLSKSYEGTGIGLSIVKKAAERMGGSVGLQSEPGQGSTFWVELRASPQVGKPEQPP